MNRSKLIVLMVVIIAAPIIFTSATLNQLNKTSEKHDEVKSVKTLNYCAVKPIELSTPNEVSIPDVKANEIKIEAYNSFKDEQLHKKYLRQGIKEEAIKLAQQEIEVQAKIEKEKAESPVEKPPTKKVEVASRQKTNKSQTFKATAYDLSVNSCGKAMGSKGYGITRNGTNLAGKTREQAMTVAVDPKVIKLGTRLKITFPEPYEHFTGIYTANDTGGAIKKYKIDIFMGDFSNNKTHQSVWDFGVRDVQVEILR